MNRRGGRKRGAAAAAVLTMMTALVAIVAVALGGSLHQRDKVLSRLGYARAYYSASALVKLVPGIINAEIAAASPNMPLITAIISLAEGESLSASSFFDSFPELSGDVRPNVTITREKPDIASIEPNPADIIFTVSTQAVSNGEYSFFSQRFRLGAGKSGGMFTAGFRASENAPLWSLAADIDTVAANEIILDDLPVLHRLRYGKYAGFSEVLLNESGVIKSAQINAANRIISIYADTNTSDGGYQNLTFILRGKVNGAFTWRDENCADQITNIIVMGGGSVFIIVEDGTEYIPQSGVNIAHYSWFNNLLVYGQGVYPPLYGYDGVNFPPVFAKTRNTLDTDGIVLPGKILALHEGYPLLDGTIHNRVYLIDRNEHNGAYLGEDSSFFGCIYSPGSVIADTPASSMLIGAVIAKGRSGTWSGYNAFARPLVYNPDGSFYSPPELDGVIGGGRYVLERIR